MDNEMHKKSYVLSGWPVKTGDVDPNEPAVLPFSQDVRKWCQEGKKVRVTFEVVEESADA